MITIVNHWLASLKTHTTDEKSNSTTMGLEPVGRLIHWATRPSEMYHMCNVLKLQDNTATNKDFLNITLTVTYRFSYSLRTNLWKLSSEASYLSWLTYSEKQQLTDALKSTGWRRVNYKHLTFILNINTYSTLLNHFLIENCNWQYSDNSLPHKICWYYNSIVLSFIVTKVTSEHYWLNWKIYYGSLKLIDVKNINSCCLCLFCYIVFSQTITIFF